MAKIIYGISGEGSGHSSRAREIGSHLVSRGHQVKIVSYDRGYRNLKNDFDALEIVGLSITSQDNKVSLLKTITNNLANIPEGTRAFNVLRSEFKRFAPECVITDFEPCTAYLANHYELPLITIDNQHRMRYMEYECPASLRKDSLITETVIRAMVPRPWVSLITTFHFGKLLNERSFLFPPILRDSVLSLTPTVGEHILVYVTSGFESLLELLPRFSRERFIVYGYDRADREGNLQFRPFSQNGFLEDLASAKAVIATAGFTLISEALYLAKPYLAFPMQGQFEQHLNALMLENQGFGGQCLRPDADALAAFLYRLPEYEEKLKAYPRNGNDDIKIKIDELLTNDRELLSTYRR